MTSVVLIDYEPVPHYDGIGPANRMTPAGRELLRAHRLERGISDVSGSVAFCATHWSLMPCQECDEIDEWMQQ
jgi:hypothetical protein